MDNYDIKEKSKENIEENQKNEDTVRKRCQYEMRKTSYWRGKHKTRPITVKKRENIEVRQKWENNSKTRQYEIRHDLREGVKDDNYV